MNAWEEYLAAARRLDAVRRGAAVAASEQSRAVHAAHEELATVRARLAVQHSRLRALGVAEAELRPSPAEVAAAAESMAGGPEAVLAALRQACAPVDAATEAAVGARTRRSGRPRIGGRSRPWLRNLLMYGPYALVVLVVQLALYLIVDSVSLPALLCGLTMPLAAFGLGWLTIGVAFPTGPDGRVDRTPIFGAAVCVVVPTALSFVGAAALTLVQ